MRRKLLLLMTATAIMGAARAFTSRPRCVVQDRLSWLAAKVHLATSQRSLELPLRPTWPATLLVACIAP